MTEPLDRCPCGICSPPPDPGVPVTWGLYTPMEIVNALGPEHLREPDPCAGNPERWFRSWARVFDGTTFDGVVFELPPEPKPRRRRTVSGESAWRTATLNGPVAW